MSAPAVARQPVVLPLRSAEFWQNPYPVLDEARAAHRTARTHSGELVVLSAGDTEAVSANLALAPLGVDALDRLGMTDGSFRRWRALSLNAHSGYNHARLRALVIRAFSPKQVERVRHEVAADARRIVDRLGAEPFDVHQAIGHEVPLHSICVFLGIPREDAARIDRFMVGTEEGFSFPMTAEKQARADIGIDALYEYVTELVERRKAVPGDDLVTALIEAEINGDRLSHEEMLAMVVNLIGGAVGSTDAGIANMVHLMATEGAEVDVVRRDPALIPAFVEEVLRYRPPFRSTRRKALEPAEVAGEHLEPGDTVFISRQAANRDPDRFVDPHRFWVRRPAERHASFGHGPHFCLGQALARLNLTETARVLVSRWDGVELLDPNPRRVPFDPAERFESLQVRPTLHGGPG